MNWRARLPIQYHPDRPEQVTVAGRRQRLTPTEERLFAHLFARRGYVILWPDLDRVAFGALNDVEPAQVYWHIHNLRHKLRPARLETISGRGVVLH